VIPPHSTTGKISALKQTLAQYGIIDDVMDVEPTTQSGATSSKADKNHKKKFPHLFC